MTARLSYPSFKGSFKSFEVTVSTNYEHGIKSCIHVFSQGGRDKVVEYLWLKYLWDELSKLEYEFFITLPEVLNSEIKVAALRAVLVLGKRKTRKRLCENPFLKERERPTRIRYQGFKRLDVELSRVERKLPKIPKYSGYVKSSSSVGSKRRPGDPSYLEPLAIIENDYEDNVFDWYNYLTVEEFPILPSRWIYSPEETK